jgi:hypothetical protein
MFIIIYWFIIIYFINVSVTFLFYIINNLLMLNYNFSYPMRDEF